MRERDRLLWLERQWVFTLRFMGGLSQHRAGETDGLMVEHCFFQSFLLPAPLRSLSRPFICFCWSYFNDFTFLSNSRVYSSANDCASVSGTYSRTPVNKHFVCKCLSLLPAVRLFYFSLFCHFLYFALVQNELLPRLPIIAVELRKFTGQKYCMKVLYIICIIFDFFSARMH